MKQKYNRILSLVLTGVLTFSGALPVAAAAADTQSIPETASLEADFLYSETLADSTIQGVIIKLDTDATPDSAVLTSQTPQGKEETAATQIVSNYAVFQLPSVEDRTFLTVESVIADTVYETNLAPLENGTTLDASDFQETSESPAMYDLEELSPEKKAAVEESVITTDLDETVTGEDIAASLEATAPSQRTRTGSSEKSGKKIIVLDPGHGAPGSGTYRDWGDMVIDEAVINFKISKYTKAALESNYSNIEVYMTKNSQNENPAIKARVEYAVSKNANILVSQHINATGENVTNASGVLAMVPKVDGEHSFNEEAALNSQELARSILDELTKLDFKDMGFQFRLSSESTYTDGSVADYYGIVRYCRMNNLPGTIIEHGFANNKNDALKLNNDNVLQAIGQADAKGIAAYLKLDSGSSETPDVPSKPVQTGWVQTNGKWYYYDNNGSKATGWRLIGNTWYYMDSSGVMLTGWQLINNKWYFLDPSGAMLTGWLLINNKWYFLDPSGAMLTDWQLINNKWYFLDPSGAMLTGWQFINNNWYYMNSSGAMLTGWQLINNKWYYMNSSGAMLTGWQLINNKWYYMDASGAMLTGWQLINNKWYYMNSSGAMLTGWQFINHKWYYLNSSGAMLTGTQKIDGKTYTFTESGDLVE